MIIFTPAFVFCLLFCAILLQNSGQGVTSKDLERGSLYSVELDAYKRQKSVWDREREELVFDRQAMQLSLKEKEAELASMQELVR